MAIVLQDESYSVNLAVSYSNGKQMFHTPFCLDIPVSDAPFQTRQATLTSVHWSREAGFPTLSPDTSATRSPTPPRPSVPAPMPLCNCLTPQHSTPVPTRPTMLVRTLLMSRCQISPPASPASTSPKTLHTPPPPLASPRRPLQPVWRRQPLGCHHLRPRREILTVVSLAAPLPASWLELLSAPLFSPLFCSSSGADTCANSKPKLRSN